MSVNYEYDFTQGLYRARIKTTYKRSDMSMSDHVFSKPFKFRSAKEPPTPKDTWVRKTWSGENRIYYGSSVWTDGTNIYAKSYDGDVVLNKSTDEWEPIQWYQYVPSWMEEPEEMSPVKGFIFTDGIYMYYGPDDYTDFQKVLNKETHTWYEKVWYDTDGEIFYNLQGTHVWTDGDDLYYDSDYVLNKETGRWDVIEFQNVPDMFDPAGSIWTDGTRTYYSRFDEQYIFNKETKTWSEVTFNIDISLGSYVWIDADGNVYYSDGHYSPITGIEYVHYVLNKRTGLWEEKTWNGKNNFYGSDVWTDGRNVYVTTDGDSYILT